MRKGVSENKQTVLKPNGRILKQLENRGYKYVQVLGLTQDRHEEYLEPHYLLLVPIKELPADPAKKDIYEPIDSAYLEEWFAHSDDHTEIRVAAKV